MKKSLLLAIAIFTLSHRVCGSSTLQELKNNDFGEIKLNHVTMSLIHYGEKFQSSSPSLKGMFTHASGSPQYDSHASVIKGVWKTSGGSFEMKQTLTLLKKGEYSMKVELKSGNPVKTNDLALELRLPTANFAGQSISVDNAVIKLPENFGGKTFLLDKQFDNGKIEIPMGNGKLEFTGISRAHLQDNRRYQQQNFALRLRFSPWKGDLSTSSIMVYFKFTPPSNPQVILDNLTNWRVIPMPVEAETDSILDFSGMLDAPAGKHGRVIVSNGKFAFENKPADPVRFYGTNFYFDVCFPERDDAEYLAEIISKHGYNSVRFHHFDHQLSNKNSPDGADLDPVQLDKMDYLFKCLKDKGIYLTLDLMCNRQMRRPDGKNMEIQETKLMIMLDQRYQENYRKFASALLNHVNPYTGMAYKDDPAVAFICLINEDALFYIALEYPRLPSEAKNLFNERFNEWKKSNSGNVYNYVTELQRNNYRELFQYFRDLGVKAPLTDMNNTNREFAMAAMRKDFDYVDSHPYYAHPTFIGKAWSMPMKIASRSAIDDFASSPAYCFNNRMFGQPFTITEFNFDSPNPSRAEGGALMGAYAALQDWDALYRYGYVDRISSLRKPAPVGIFDTIYDPMKWLGDRLGILLFQRGDVRPATKKILIKVDENTTLFSAEGKPLRFSKIQDAVGLVSQVGVVYGKNGIDANLDDERFLVEIKKKHLFGAGKFDFAGRFAKSSTGEITLDGKAGYLLVETPRSAVVVNLKSGKLASGALTVDNKKDFALFSASSMDGKPLTDSTRIMLLHLTNVYNSKAVYRDAQMEIIEKIGQPPHMVRRGVANISLRLSPGSTPEVYAVDLAGTRLGKINSNFEKGILHFTADTFVFNTPTLVYEIIR